MTIEQLKQENAELREHIRRYKDALAGTRDYINDLEWQCKFSNDKIVRMQATIAELEALIAEKENALALGEAALQHLGAKLWCHEHQYSELAGYVDVHTAAIAPLVLQFIEDADFMNAAADYALSAMEDPARE